MRSAKADAPLIVPEEGRQYFIRFGDWHVSGRSRNYATGDMEAGVSVYDAVGKDGAFDVVLGPDQGEWTETDFHDHLRQAVVNAVPVYVVTGAVVGLGGDGEPLIENPVIVGHVDPRQVR